MNNGTFSGRLGKDPELRSVGDREVCNFSLAVNRRKKDAPTQWWDVSVWGKQAEVAARYLRKGSEVVVAGTVDFREFERRDGSAGFALTLDCREFSFVGAKAEDGGSQPQPAAPIRTPADDDIPF